MVQTTAILALVCVAQALDLHRRGAQGNSSAAHGPIKASSTRKLESLGKEGSVSASVKQKLENVGKQSGSTTIPGYYESHTKGRGIWKWGNALVAYQRHFGGLAGHPVSMSLFRSPSASLRSGYSRAGRCSCGGVL
jgi:hypothetical protein